MTTEMLEHIGNVEFMGQTFIVRRENYEAFKGVIHLVKPAQTVPAGCADKEIPTVGEEMKGRPTKGKIFATEHTGASATSASACFGGHIIDNKQALETPMKTNSEYIGCVLEDIDLQGLLNNLLEAATTNRPKSVDEIKSRKDDWRTLSKVLATPPKDTL